MKHLRSMRLVVPRDVEVSVSGKKAGKRSFVNISSKSIHVSKNKGGLSSWLLKNKPKISFNDKKKSMRVGSSRIVFKNNKKYSNVKDFFKGSLKMKKERTSKKKNIKRTSKKKSIKRRKLSR